MVLLPEERGMTLTELRQIAARQQHQIEAQQQLLVAKEQRLKFLKQQEARHHSLSEQHLETNCLMTLRDKVEAQELKLRQLRALRGQVEQQKTNNSNLGTELDSIRALFCEKQKELDLAVNKVEELTCQLEEIKKNSRKNYIISSTSELENLRRELTYRTKLSEQQNNYICQQREKICNKQQDIANLDKKINELNERLHRKRILNEHFASQIHLSSLSGSSSCSIVNNNVLTKIETRVSEVLEPEHTQDDLAANLLGHKCDFGEFSLTKNDPKYQTLPYNTKFTLKEKQLEDSLSSSSSSVTTEEESSSKSETSNDRKDAKPFSNMCNFSPRPFNNAALSSNSGVQKVILQKKSDCIQPVLQNNTLESNGSENVSENKEVCSESVINKNVDLVKLPILSKSASHFGSSIAQNNLPKLVKPAVPPKPALSVKPMFANRETNHSSRKSTSEQDTVTMALTFLKNKSSDKEKSDFRYPVTKDTSQDPLLPKSRILTYFSKTILQPDGGVHEQNEKSSTTETSKRKSAFGQLPIKPKPLTIRKNPSIEPPKLKVQSVTSSYRRSAESPSKVTRSLPSSETDEKTTDLSAQKCNASLDPSLKIHPLNVDSEASQELKEAQIVNVCETRQESESAVAKSNERNETASDETDSLSDQSDVDEVDELSSALHKMKKGNLKGEKESIRGSRRVSFDPLALLLDAALEGELELVKKISSEVVNPSAANDEGITALHNAICAGQFEVVKFLVEFGCDVNAPDSDGWTPLHCAASCNNLAMVTFLVERGACIFATTLSDQETAAEKCEEDGAGFDGCSEYLFSLQDNLGVMNNGVVYAVYDYDVQNADELGFRNGDMLVVLRRSDDEENEWWWCRLHDEEGYVPRNLLGLHPRVTCPNVEKPIL